MSEVICELDSALILEFCDSPVFIEIGGCDSLMHMDFVDGVVVSYSFYLVGLLHLEVVE